MKIIDNAKDRVLRSPVLLCAVALFLALIVLVSLMSIMNEPALVYKAF